MTHRQKVDLLREDLARRDVASLTVAPPFLRMLWALGIAIPPPLFWRPASLAIFYGSVGLLIGSLLWATDLLPDSPAVRSVILACVALLYGFWGTWFYRRKARELNLPSWENYPTESHATQTDHATQSDPGLKPT